MAGATNSLNGDVIGLHGSLITPVDDYWVVKLSDVGVIEWQKCMGGSNADKARAIIQTTDGGYCVAGITQSIDGDVMGLHGTNGSFDYWVVKLSSEVSLQEQMTSHEIVNMYPNPTNKKINIESTIPIEKVVLFDLIGNEIFEARGQGFITQLDVTNFAKGTYLCRLFDKNNYLITVRKVVIE